MYYIYSFEDFERMIKHWLATRPNAYLGSPYGFNQHKILLKPMSDNEADQILVEMKEQIPPLQHLSDDQLMVTRDPNVTQTDKYYITLNGEIHIELGEETSNISGDSFYAYGQ